MNAATNSKTENGGRKGRASATQRDKAVKIYNDVKEKLGVEAPEFRQTVLKKITKDLDVQPATASVYYYHAKEQDGNPQTTRMRRASTGERTTGKATSTARKRSAGAENATVANSRAGMPRLFVAERGEDKAFFLTEEAADSYANRRSGTEVRRARKADFR